MLSESSLPLRRKRTCLKLSVYLAVLKSWIDSERTCPLCFKKAFFISGYGYVTDDHIPFEIDHVIPLNKGGLDIEKNLRYMCRTCNRKKGNS